MVIAEETIDLPVEGGRMRTLVVRPRVAGRFPGLVAYSDIFQLTASTRRWLARFAGHGYVVAAPEIYHRIEPPGAAFAFDDAGRERGGADAAKTSVASWDSDLKFLLAMLNARADVAPGKLGAIGTCTGGHIAFRAAFDPGIKATACFYPTGIEDGKLGSEPDAGSLARAREIRGELLLVFGAQDPHVPAEGRATIDAALEQAGVRVTTRLFEAEHAFMRDEGPRYDPAATDAAISAALELFAKNLNP